MEDEYPKKFDTRGTPVSFGETDTPDTEISLGLEYFLNNEEKKEGNLILNHFTEYYDRISYEEIVYSFYLFLETTTLPEEIKKIKPDNFKCDFIRYLDGDGWILLEENEFIFLDNDLNLSNLKIMIKATVYPYDQYNIIKKCDDIEKEINYTYNEMLEKNLDNSPPDAPLNLVVLTANPLMDGKEELRTMNDFNIITSTIYNLFETEDYLKYTEFGPLTKKTLKNILSNKEKIPVILHLICKSTYIKDEKSNKYKANLIFEKIYNSKRPFDNYDLEFVDENTLMEELFKGELAEEIKENIKKITLIISTQLAEDVYNNIFKNFGFKNILVQHTTLADINFITEFNKSFYQDLIRHLAKPINTIFESALIISNEKTDFKTFCCCFHSHKDTCSCPILENLTNEIYNKESIDDPKKNKMKTLIPHFYHLFPLCKVYISSKGNNSIINSKIPNYSFSLHSGTCLTYMNPDSISCFLHEVHKSSKKLFYNVCCCDEKPENHNINMIFRKDFTEENKNHQIHFRKAGTLREKINFPNYEKQKLLVGKNKSIFQALQFFFSGFNYCNIYGDNIENLKKFGRILKEYYLERYYFYELNNNDKNENNTNEDMSLNRNISEPIINTVYNNEQGFIKNDDINLTRKLSYPLSSDQPHQIKEILEIEYENFINAQQEFNFNIIYFIYISDEEKINKNNKKISLNNKKIIFFSEKKLTIIDNILNIKLTKEPIFQSESKYYKNTGKVSLNEYIKFQHLKDVQNWRKMRNWDS